MKLARKGRLYYIETALEVKDEKETVKNVVARESASNIPKELQQPSKNISRIHRIQNVTFVR